MSFVNDMGKYLTIISPGDNSAYFILIQVTAMSIPYFILRLRVLLLFIDVHPIIGNVCAV